MKTANYQLFNTLRSVGFILSIFCLCALFAGTTAAQDASQRFRIGERLTYNVSFGKFLNAAYAEMSVVSSGKLSGQDVVELRSKLKTLGVVSAAFFPFDESRIVFAAPDTGLPLYISKTTNYGVEPKEVIGNYLKEPTSSFDLLSLIYKARDANGAGSFPLSEDGQFYTVTFQPTVSEKVKTEAGEFDTVVSIVQSDYLTAHGIKELKINFATEESHIPALIRFKTAKGIVMASLAAIQIPKPVVATPTPVTTPVAAVTPTPKPTPAPYIENQPISPELGFALGEKLDYAITQGGKPIATISLAAKERKLFQNEDSLLLTATVTGVEQGSSTFVMGDSIRVQVDPETLAPRQTESRFSGELKSLNQTVTFDKKSGSITFGGANTIEAPIGTHTILSMIYAMRSFNLRPSKDPKAPVNDTRVAVFWESEVNVFTLQPMIPEQITISGEQISAQMIVVTTSSEVLDKQGLRIWLAADTRVPVRFSLGSYQADLVSPTKNLSR